MRRAVQRLCETVIARSILRGDAPAGGRLRLHVQDGEIVVRVVPPPADDDDEDDHDLDELAADEARET